MWIRLTVALRSFINEPFWRSFNICFHKIKKKIVRKIIYLIIKIFSKLVPLDYV